MNLIKCYLIKKFDNKILIKKKQTLTYCCLIVIKKTFFIFCTFHGKIFLLFFRFFAKKSKTNSLGFSRWQNLCLNHLAWPNQLMQIKIQFTLNGLMHFECTSAWQKTNLIYWLLKYRRVYVCVHIYIYILYNVCIYTHKCINMHIYIHKRIHKVIHTQVHTNVEMHIYIYMHPQMYVCIYTHTYICIYIWVYIYVQTYANIHT